MTASSAAVALFGLAACQATPGVSTPAPASSSGPTPPARDGTPPGESTALPTAAGVQPGATAVATGPTRGQTTIEWWMPRLGIYQTEDAIVAAYNSSQDRVVVKKVYAPVDIGTMSSKALTAIAAGTPPETAEFDRFIVASWGAKRALTDLSDRAASAKIAADQYWPFAWDEASYKGRLYALPMDTDARGIYYNVDAFEEVGLDPEKPPQTIAELDAAAEKLTKKDGRKFIRWGYSPAFHQSFHYAVGFQFGGEFYDKATNKCTANEPRIVEAFEWMKSYADRYDIQDMEAFQSAFGTQTNDPFLTSQIAMYAQGDWGLNAIREFKPDLNFGVTAMPGKTGPAPCMAGGWSEVLPKGAKNQDEGFDFISYYTGKVGQLAWCLGEMLIPTIVELSTEPGFTKDPKHAKFMDFLKTAKNRPAIPAGQVLWNRLGEAQSAVMHGHQTPKEALDDVTRATDDELAKYS